MKKLLLYSAAISIVLLSMLSQTESHDYSEVKEGRWKTTSSPECEGYNLSTYNTLVEQNSDNKPDEYRFSQFGHRVVVTGLKLESPRISVLGEVSEEYMHFEILESSNRGTSLSVWSVEILEDEEELDYIYWQTEHYANDVWVNCSGVWIGSVCSGKEYVIGVPNFLEGYRRYSVKCTGTLEWIGS